MNIPSRFTVVETISFQSSSDQPVDAGAYPFSRTLKTDEQPVIRRFTVTPDWQPLPCLWLENASLLHFSNDVGRNETEVPTVERRQALTAAVIELGVESFDPETNSSFHVPVIAILPGESCRFSPVSLKEVWVRCRQGEARCTLTLLPE